MKKRILSFLLGICMIAVLFVGCGSGDNSKGTITSYKDELLKDYLLFSQEIVTKRGKTISYFDEYGYQTIRETYVNDEFESGFSNRYSWECNKDGKPIKGTMENGTTIEIEYDKKGNKVKEITSVEIEGEIRTIQEQEYNEHGALIRLWQYYGDGQETIYDYKYNKDGKPEEVTAYADWHEEQYSQDYSVDSTEMWGTEMTEPQEYQYMYKQVCSYNDDGTIATITEYDSYGNPLKETNSKGILLKEYYGSDEIEWEHILDENGNIVSYVDYDNDVTGEILEEYDYEYDENGNISKMYCYDGNGSCLSEGSCEYKLDEYGVPVEIKVYSDGKLSGKLDCDVKYDADGNLIHESKYIPYFGDEVLRIDYGYDAKGNLVKEVVCSNKDTIIAGYEMIVSEDKNSVTIVEYSYGSNYGDTSKSTKVYLKKDTDFESLLDDKEIELGKLQEELEARKAEEEKQAILQAYKNWMGDASFNLYMIKTSDSDVPYMIAYQEFGAVLLHYENRQVKTINNLTNYPYVGVDILKDNRLLVSAESGGGGEIGRESEYIIWGYKDGKFDVLDSHVSGYYVDKTIWEAVNYYKDSNDNDISKSEFDAWLSSCQKDVLINNGYSSVEEAYENMIVFE